MQLHLTSLRGKEYFAKEPEPGGFGPLEPEPLEKKYPEPERVGEKIRRRSRLKKNSGAGAAKKFVPVLILLQTYSVIFYLEWNPNTFNSQY